RDVVAQVRTPAEIYNRRTDRLVERHRRFAKALDSSPIAQRLSKRTAQHHSYVFDGVMVIYVQIARGLDLQVEESMARETFQHVIEKRNPRPCLAAPCTVELERDRDRSLARLAFDFRAALSLGRHRLHDRPRAGLILISQARFTFALHLNSRVPASLFLPPRRSATPSRAHAPRNLPSAPNAPRLGRAPQSRPATPRLYWFVSGNRMHPKATRNAPRPRSAERDWGPQGSRRAALA